MKGDPKDKPARTPREPQDYEAAKAEYEKENPGLKYEDLPTRKRNMLAEDQKYHREYADLCAAIMNRSRQMGRT